jgi:actin-related protein
LVTLRLRHKYLELMFEKFQTPALFMSKDSVLTCFACGKTTGLVVDVGAETTSVTPIHEGWLESKGT